MIGLVVATHGPLAEALLTTVGMIVGPPAQSRAISMSRGDSPDELRRQLSRLIDEVDSGEGVLIMADMFGGTPANVGMLLLDSGHVDLLTGVNLPMLIKFMSYRERYSLQELASVLKIHAREGTVLASDVLHRE